MDPPYNTGSDSFNYNDRFNHSTYLTFMKNRLEIARELLRDDGVIFVQCDDNEQAYLKVLMDEIFGRENFVNCIAVQVKSSAGFKVVNKGVMEVMEYILFYAKNKSMFSENKVFKNVPYDDNYNLFVENINDEISEWKIAKLTDKFPLKDLNSISKQLNIKPKELQNLIFSKFALEHLNQVFRYTAINDDAGQETIDARNKSILDNKIYIVETSKGKRYIHKGNQIFFYSSKVKNINNQMVPAEQISNIWTDIRWEGIAREGQITLKKGKKPEALIKRILEISTNENDLVLDFFAGSGTTLAVAHKMKRRYIGIEQMEYIESITKERLKKVIEGEQGGISKAVSWSGGGNLIYCELASLNAKFIEKIENSSDENELNQIYENLQKLAFIDYRVDIKNDLKDDEFSNLDFTSKKRILKKCLDRNMDYIPYADIDDSEYKIDERAKKLNKIFYGENDG
ncbi:site-specific DNA-methyltransferase [Campylobacter sp. CX2-4080-23]|nr:site-specific DNA-methyltransferase [Campylobacter sp. CX2-4080-23]